MRDDDAPRTGPPDSDPATPARGGATRIGRLLARTEAAAEPLVGTVKDGVNSALETAVAGLREMELPGARVRRVRRLGRAPLLSLYDLRPEARRARPVEVGLRTIEVDDIRGTSVGGGDQRGGDFLPLKLFRGRNWHARWQRIRAAQDHLETLPPIDVVKYDGAYWVVDGHNRVAVAKYAGQPDIDAQVVELVPPGGRRTEPIGSLAAIVEESRPVRGRAKSDEP